MSVISENKALYLIWVCLTFFTEGGLLSTFPAVTAKIFGAKVGPIIYGFIFFGFAVANILAFIVAKFGLKYLTYPGIFWIGFGLTLIAGILNIFLKENLNWSELRKQKSLKSARIGIELQKKAPSLSGLSNRIL